MKTNNAFNKIYNLTKKIILLLAVFILLFGCSSDEQKEEFVYPSNLVLSGYEVTSDVKVYTKDGEVKDLKSISNFLKAYSSLNPEPFELKKGFVELNQASDTINYISKDFAFFKNNDSRIEKAFGNRVPKVVGKEIYFYPKDTLFQKYSPFGGEFKAIIIELGNYKPYFKNLLPSYIPDNSDFSLYKSLLAFVAKGDTNKLEFPYLNYYISRTTYNQKSWKASKWTINNTFDKNTITFLKLGDTLAIQEGKKIYKKY